MGIKERNKNNVISRWNKTYKNDLIFLKSVENPDEIRSLICGYLAGDGYVKIRKENKREKLHYTVRFFPDHESLIEPFTEAIKKLYNKEARVIKHKSFYEIIIHSKTIVNDLLSFGKFGTYLWKVPKLKNNQCKVNWLRGIYDADAYVAKDYIRLKCVNESGIVGVRSLLKELGINTTMYRYEPINKNWSTNFILDIRGIGEIMKFSEIVGFNHEQKRLKVSNMIDIKMPRSLS